MIPKRVIQMFTGDAMPPELVAVRRGMIERNPGYEFRLFGRADVEAFVGDHYDARTLAAYHRIDPRYGAAKADLFRYLAIHALGGIYLDVKSYFADPIDAVLRDDDDYIISQWRNGAEEMHAGFGLHRDLADVAGGEFQQWHVIAHAGHPFLAAVIERVLDNIEHYSSWRFGVGRIGVQRLTGPIAYTRAIAPIMASASYRRVPDETVLSLHYSVAGGYSHMTTFKDHYSLQKRSVVRMPLHARPSEAAFRVAKGVRDLLRR